MKVYTENYVLEDDHYTFQIILLSADNRMSSKVIGLSVAMTLWTATNYK